MAIDLSKGLKTAYQFQREIESLSAQFKMKQDDWIEACKEADSLRTKLKLAELHGAALMLQNFVLKDKLTIALKALEYIKDKNHTDPGDEALKEEYNARAARTYDKAVEALSQVRIPEVKK